ncbi:MAG: thioredoxin family protein [Rubrivivax sp.]|nr:thioredoxin family protein [Rubrivivax sp.]
MNIKSLAAALLLGLGSVTAWAAAAIGQPAPAFVGTDATGKAVSLADLRGKTVVLEWVNPGCPYVRKHYNVNNMQATQKGAVDRGVVWLAINSTAKDASDYLTPERMSAWMKEQKASASATVMDTDGRIGRAFGARTTPHMYVIDARGLLVYAGAIDNKPTPRSSDVAGATNFVNQALAEVLAGKPVSTPATQAYGCSVKYSAM